MTSLLPILRRKWLRVCAAALCTPVVVFALLCLAFPLPTDRLSPGAGSRVVMDREGRVLRAFLGADDMWQIRRRLADLPRSLIEATIAVEDSRFRYHPGVDPVAVTRAVLSNVRRGRVVSGASTITMQVAKLIEPKRRTLSSKIIEAFRALQIELAFSKDEILEHYLNLAPYGGNLVGAEAAARRYFGKPARDLALWESALLAGLPKRPARLRPDRYPQRARRRRDYVLYRMRTCGYISSEVLSQALRQPVAVKARAFPFKAPHLAEEVLRRSGGQKCVVTTIDGSVQGIARRALRRGVRELREAGVTNGAVVVIENRAAAVRALVGSADFFAEADCGQINGTLAPRSPGSALKPFTYALAFDRGLCSPTQFLADVPTHFGAYEPENYDRRFYGPVSAADALASSLNVPAVRLLNEVGPQRLADTLRSVGISTVGRPSTAGLSLTLGACAVKLLELTNAYAALARGGLYQPYRVLEGEPVSAETRVLSAAASFLIAEILSDTKRMGLRSLHTSAGARPRFAWKTGTSSGRRDAWAIGFNPDYTVGVWTGNFTGRPSYALVGRKAATPIVREVFERLHRDGPPQWYDPPPSVGTRSVCALSGMPVGPHCLRQKDGRYVQGVSPSRPCTVHQAVMVDKETRRRLCRGCVQGREHTREVAEVWPPEVDAWLRAQGTISRPAPPHYPDCRAAGREFQPRIVSPIDGQVFVKRAAARDASSKVRLRALVGPGVRSLCWFVDGSLYRRTAPSETIFWQLRPGPHKVVCVDDSGQSARSDISVQ